MSLNTKRKAYKQKQTRLTFDPLASSSSPTVMSPAKIRYELPSTRLTIASSSRAVAVESESNTILSGPKASTGKKQMSIKTRSARLPFKALLTPEKSSQTHMITVADRPDEGGVQSSPNTARFLRSSGRLRTADFERVGDSSDGSLPEDTTLVRSNKRLRGTATKLPVVDLDSLSDTDTSSKRNEAPIPARVRPSASLRTYVDISSESPSDSNANVHPRQGSDVDDESEDPISSPMKRSRPARFTQVLGVAPSPQKRRRLHAITDSSEDDLPSSNRSSTHRAANRYTRQSKVRKHRTEKQKTLELLKRKRAGEVIDTLTESESESDQDTDLEIHHHLSEFEDESEGGVVDTTDVTSRKNVDGYDSDFVVDTEEGDLGIPDLALSIPLEFTHAAHKPLKEHFKDAIEWMVHNKVNPAFLRNDPLYVQAFKKLDDEYGGYAKSKFVSSQWTAEFTRAIYARPHLLERALAPGEGIDITGEGKCDVCNHRKHPPKYQIQFAGKAYYKDSLEEIEQDSEDSSSEEDDRASLQAQSVNVDGQVIPSEETTWLSGRFCMANATQAHSLIHWKFALNEWVISNLEAQGYMTPEKLAEREKLKGRQRRTYANNIVDRWVLDGHIKDLYRDFKINLEAAREAKQERWSGGRFMGRK